MRLSILFLLALLLVPSMVYADDSSNLHDLYVGAKVYGDSSDLLQAQADKGNPEAQFYMGLLSIVHSGDDGREADMNAVKWLRKSAEQGYAEAQRQMGIMYAIGRGVKKDPVEAQKWFQKALDTWRPLAEHGNTEAQAQMGDTYSTIDLYSDSKDAKKYEAMAFKWTLKAAEGGVASAQCDLSLMYDHGEGVNKDHAESLKWLRKSAQQGDGDAQNFLAEESKEVNWPEAYFWFSLSKHEIFSDPKDIENAAKHLTTEQKEIEDKKIREWKPTPAQAPPNQAK